MRIEEKPKIEFVIGDIRNYESVSQAMSPSRLYFSRSCSKAGLHVLYPMEAVRTNIVGTGNVLMLLLLIR